MARRSRAGRPSKLTRTARDGILDALRVGASYAAAAQHVGVSVDTFQKWRSRGRRELDRLAADPAAVPDPDEVEYAKFAEEIAKAEAEAEVTAFGRLSAAAVTDARWAAWLIEHRFSQDQPAHRVAIEPTQITVRVVYTTDALPPDPSADLPDASPAP